VAWCGDKVLAPQRTWHWSRQTSIFRQSCYMTAHLLAKTTPPPSSPYFPFTCGGCELGRIPGAGMQIQGQIDRNVDRKRWPRLALNCCKFTGTRSFRGWKHLPPRHLEGERPRICGCTIRLFVGLRHACICVVRLGRQKISRRHPRIEL